MGMIVKTARETGNALRPARSQSSDRIARSQTGFGIGDNVADASPPLAFGIPIIISTNLATAQHRVLTRAAGPEMLEILGGWYE